MPRLLPSKHAFPPWPAVVALGLLASSGCGAPPPPPPSPLALAPAERFDWAAQPIAFSPPPGGWRREGELSGGLRGIRFVREGGVGEAVGVAELYLLGDRDRRAEPRDLLERFDSFDDGSLRVALSRARWRTDEPWSPFEREAAEAVNAALDRAMAANTSGDRDAARAALGDADWAARGLRITLPDVIERVVFRPDRRSEPARYRVTGRRELVVAGEPATRVDYTLQGPERLYHCRELYVMHDNHLFIANLIGTAQDTTLFDRVVASIAFPPREKPRP